MILQPDQKILFTSPGCATRFTTTGQPDATFGSGGQAKLVGGEGAAVALQADGKFLAAGGGLISRYDDNGALDESFGVFGSAGTVATVSAIAIQTDGKIVIAGAFADLVDSSGNQDFALVRLTADGAVDASFGTRGGVLTDFLVGPANAAATSILLQADRKIVAAGLAANGANASDFAIARYTTSGQLDTTFGENGRVLTSFGHIDSVAGLAPKRRQDRCSGKFRRA